MRIGGAQVLQDAQAHRPNESGCLGTGPSARPPAPSTGPAAGPGQTIQQRLVGLRTVERIDLKEIRSLATQRGYEARLRARALAERLQLTRQQIAKLEGPKRSAGKWRS